MTTENVKYRKIPILITKWWEGNDIKGWRAEIADSYENWKPMAHDDINFEDLPFHFYSYKNEMHPKDYLVFLRRKDAVSFAKEINTKFLHNNAKIWFI